MTVRELIEHLSKLEQDRRVVICNDQDEFDIDYIEQSQDVEGRQEGWERVVGLFF